MSKERNINNENSLTTRSSHPHYHRTCFARCRYCLHRRDGEKVPLLSNIRVDIILLVIIGMTICTQGGIGRVAATGQWTHPLSIIGYILGGLILIITLAAFVGWKLPFIASDQQALFVIAILASLKVVNAVSHYLLSHA